jgi:arylsulfatase A-like enzyme
MSASVPRRQSLVLVTVDCLRADHVGFLGYRRPTTPFLDEVAREALIFQNAVVAGAPTYYYFPAILASRPPLALGRDIVGLARGEPSLATTLKQAGYATAAFCAGNPYLTNRFGYDHGFDTFDDFLGDLPDNYVAGSHTSPWLTVLNRQLEQWSHKTAWLGRLYDDAYFEYCQRIAMPAPKSLDELRRFPSADQLVDHAKDWLGSLEDGPFFLWLHFMDPHAPYYPVQTALQLMGSETTPGRARYLNSYWNRGLLKQDRFRRYQHEIMALYDAGLRWVDAQIARLTDHLQELGRWDSCVFAFTADHGEEFLEHGGRFHSPGKLTEELIRVPLLLRVPGFGKLSAAQNPVSLLHLAPTLLDILDIDVPAEFHGKSFWVDLQNGRSCHEPAVVECISGATNPFHRANRAGRRVLAVRDARYKLVWELGGGQELLFDLHDDPKEIHPLPVKKEPLIRRKLMMQARQHLFQTRDKRDQRVRCRALVQELAREWQNGTSVDPMTPVSLVH